MENKVTRMQVEQALKAAGFERTDSNPAEGLGVWKKGIYTVRVDVFGFRIAKWSDEREVVDRRGFSELDGFEAVEGEGFSYSVRSNVWA